MSSGHEKLTLSFSSSHETASYSLLELPEDVLKQLIAEGQYVGCYGPSMIFFVCYSSYSLMLRLESAS